MTGFDLPMRTGRRNPVKKGKARYFARDWEHCATLFRTRFAHCTMGCPDVLAAGMLGLQPTIGSTLIMPSFVAIIIGGLGSLPGTLLGGLLIGVASGITTVFFPSASEAVIYVLMGLVLLVRPRGLLGEEGRF